MSQLLSLSQQTPFYLTLDADVLCSKDQLTEEDLLPQGKGNYVPEGYVCAKQGPGVAQEDNVSLVGLLDFLQIASFLQRLLE